MPKKRGGGGDKSVGGDVGAENPRRIVKGRGCL